MQITDSKPYAVELESSDEYLELEEQHFGLCLACGNDQYNCEPDAANYSCDECGQHKVYGTVNLLMMDKFIFP
jgi:hypothetical protein